LKYKQTTTFSWINLPSSEKMNKPQPQQYKKQSITIRKMKYAINKNKKTLLF